MMSKARCFVGPPGPVYYKQWSIPLHFREYTVMTGHGMA